MQLLDAGADTAGPAVRSSVMTASASAAATLIGVRPMRVMSSMSQAFQDSGAVMIRVAAPPDRCVSRIRVLPLQGGQAAARGLRPAELVREMADRVRHGPVWLGVLPLKPWAS